MFQYFCGYPWVNNNAWINAGQQFGGYGPDLFSALPLEIQMRIVRAVGPNIARTLMDMEKISSKWYNIAGSLWKLFAQQDFTAAEIETARARLRDSRQDDQDWKKIYLNILTTPVNVRISFYTALPPSALAGAGRVWVSLPDGRFLVTRDPIRSRERLSFYDSATNQLVETIPVRLADSPLTLQAGVINTGGSAFLGADPSTIRVVPYVIDASTGKRKRIVGIRITNRGNSLERLTATGTIT